MKKDVKNCVVKWYDTMHDEMKVKDIISRNLRPNEWVRAKKWKSALSLFRWQHQNYPRIWSCNKQLWIIYNFWLHNETTTVTTHFQPSHSNKTSQTLPDPKYDMCPLATNTHEFHLFKTQLQWAGKKCDED